MTKPTIGIIGDGHLATATAEALEMNYTIHPLGSTWQDKTWRNADLLLVLSDNWNARLHREVQQIVSSTSIPWLRCFIQFGEGIIGPFVHSKGVCFHCADRRLLMSGKDRKEMWQLYHQLSLQPSALADPKISTFSIHHLKHLLVQEVSQIFEQQSNLQDTVIIVNLHTLQTSTHTIIADPLCTICNTLPDDTPSRAEIHLQSNPKVAEDSFRVTSLILWRDTLKQTYYGNRTGVLMGNVHDPLSPFASASVYLPLTIGQEATAGRTHRFGDSEITAIFEGLERSCGIAPRGSRTIVHDHYSHLQKVALDPQTVGTHSKEQYSLPDFPFQAFDPEKKMNWVWSYCITEQKPILVPELLAYYSLGGGKGFVYETSNGCALGGSLEEAIFHGIMEILERDAFLLTWYARLPLPRIDPFSSGDTELDLMLHRIHEIAGYEIHLFNATMEHEIPSIWAIARNKKNRGFHLICAAGTHFDPVKATKNALHELAGMMLTLDAKAEKQRKKYVNMIDKPHLVKEMPDHSMLYSIPETEHRLDFLLQQKENVQTFRDIQCPPVSKTDLKEDLEHVIQILRQQHRHIFVVNQTTSELRKQNLHCVKVIIPGMLPMTFGHHLTRLTGLPRVLEIPKKLGYTKNTLTMEQLNPHPHPFP
ncbi:TOMM precursor leader peptide-binding protein [Shimazuella sp. AN120528]|uniref:TOMM precursor leader peptide-binding protein n=1 Tax=Shimazuella soli TaxID=1892854 RepID=UPI001F0FD596|nr:TOMM precursor leader peptide-binding protein [Shimazuella soli]MCH5584457.1 TOMM precursor leader peptide-binding protein [Shimazuella soli]